MGDAESLFGSTMRLSDFPSCRGHPSLAAVYERQAQIVATALCRRATHSTNQRLDRARRLQHARELGTKLAYDYSKAVAVQFDFFCESFFDDSLLLVAKHLLVRSPISAVFRFGGDAKCAVERDIHLGEDLAELGKQVLVTENT